MSGLPLYFNYLTSLSDDKKNGNISATAIAEALGLNDVQVRKDLASVSRGGRPKVGYSALELIGDIGRSLGFENHDGVIVAGMGNLGKAMLECESFADYGLDIICGFDRNEELIGLSMGRIKHWYQGTEYCIDEFCAAGRFQNKGIGSRFLREIEAYLADRGIRHIFLLTDRDVPAHAFYLKNRFRECGGNIALAREIDSKPG